MMEALLFTKLERIEPLGVNFKCDLNHNFTFEVLGKTIR